MVEQVSGQPFAGYMQQRIFDPLGMSDSYPSIGAARSHGQPDRVVRGDVDSVHAGLSRPRCRPAARPNGLARA